MQSRLFRDFWVGKASEPTSLAIRRTHARGLLFAFATPWNSTFCLHRSVLSSHSITKAMKDGTQVRWRLFACVLTSICCWRKKKTYRRLVSFYTPYRLPAHILKPKIRHVNAIVIPRGFALLVNFTALYRKSVLVIRSFFCPFATGAFQLLIMCDRYSLNS